MRVRTLRVLMLPFAVTPVGPEWFHPLHTTLTQLTYSAADHAVQISVRAFAEDFHTAVARSLGPRSTLAAEVSDSAAFAYLAATFRLLDQSGVPVPLAWCRVKRTGDLLWLCLQASLPRGLGGIQVSNQILCDLFEDQINILQVTSGGRTESLLFTKDDPPRRLR